MLNNRKLLVDSHSGVSDFVRPWIDQEFWDLGQAATDSSAMYIVGRQTVVQNGNLIKKLATAGAVVVLSIPEEGSETLLTMCLRWGFGELLQQGRIVLIGGGHMHPRWPHVQLDYFLPKIHDFDTNHVAIDQAKDLFDRLQKPYKFLFLNGRQRSHRKYLIERFRLSGLLNQSLWTCLDTGKDLLTSTNTGFWFDLDVADSERIQIHLMHQAQDLMQSDSNIQYLPAQYEVDRYRNNVAVPTNSRFVERQLWNNEWGAVYLNPDAYRDTYFSLVTETVFNYPYSFRTEKIWKPIAIGHPWIAVANQGFYRDLRNLGFRTFDGVIDESFDLIDSSQDRIERIATIVEDLYQQDLDQFLAQCYNTCKYNQQHYAEMVKKIPAQFPDRLYQFLIKHA